MVASMVAPKVAPAIAAAALALAAARPAAAEPNVAKADALFAEGVKLRDSNLALACAKFGQSLQLNPQAIGVLLNVAMCDEKHGRIASAVRRYRETRERAIEQRFPEYLKAADAKLAELGPEVPRVTIRFERPPPPQTRVVVDDRVVAPSELEALPLDPGERVIIVSAPGRIAYERRLLVGRRERREVVVPPLARPSARRTTGKIVVAAGGAAVAAGVILGLAAKIRYENQLARPFEEGGCRKVGGTVECAGNGYSAIKSALQLGDIGTAVAGAGLAAALVGGYLWFFAPTPSGEQHRVSVVPRLGPDGGGLAVTGRF
jgi:hypothetical protein